MSQPGQEKNTKQDNDAVNLSETQNGLQGANGQELMNELECLRVEKNKISQLLSDEKLLRQNQEIILIKTNRELADKVSKLEKASEEAHASRRAALNLMEDAIAAKEALRVNEERMRRQKEAFQAAVNGAPLRESLYIIASLVIEETGGDARTAFYMADAEGKHLHPVLGAGNMQESYLREIDNFVIGEDSFACGLAVPTGLPILTTDVLEDPLWKPWTHIAKKYNYRGCWSFPIKTYDNKAVGTFAIYFSEAREAKPTDLALADVVTQTAAVIISSDMDTQKRIHAEEALRESEHKYRTKLEQDVYNRTAELSASKELLQATMDASMDMIQVFEAVRNQEGEIIDFKYLLINHEAEKWMPDVIGKNLLEQQPGVIEAGIFDTFKQVVETGTANQSERRYVHEQFNGWFHQSAVKLGDGVATTTTNTTVRKQAEQDLRQSKELLQLIIDAPNIGIVVYKTVRNEAGEIIDFLHDYVNRASIDMLGEDLPANC